MVRLIALLMVAALLVPLAQTQEKKETPVGVDAATIAAYEKLGARYGAFAMTKMGWMAFKVGKDAIVPGAIPAFQFEVFPAKKLPSPGVNFALI